ncbi:subtilisin-like protease SBT1.7 [Magnolia sinica]|uniref:subtilisin-like protease SBT1.7 n=1 Tax=Magnolia sinica TaxID=86752 RepID=UPI002659BDA3|nr:subtilisin-like protease SBT1.7 [Magnolia sinica]
MERMRFSVLFLLCCLLTCKSANALEKKTYIVHTSKSSMPSRFTQPQLWYDSSLNSVSDSAKIIYTYETIIHGFSARLTEEEARALETQEGILSVLPELRYELHTTRTPEFLGLDNSAAFQPESDSDADIVIGVLDTGVWPESKSFDDTGLGPVPPGWKGECEEGTNFKPATSCNRKLIGARFFARGYEANFGPVDQSKESRSPRDDDGHGTHTATTAAGAAVSDASLFGYAVGTARGMAARARVAAYKVCWMGGCFSSDILAAMETAIGDGVDVMSLSLGGSNADYYRDSVAIGAFSAMQRGIFVSCSAGNAGPNQYTLSNVAPWITTVGAGTLDRDFPAYVRLGNGKNFSGASLYSGKPLPEKSLPLIYAGNATNMTSGNLCMVGTLIPDKVAGKIVLCERGINPRVQKGYAVRDAGGFGMILANTAANKEELVADAHLLPATGVGQRTGDVIKDYIFTDSNPTATILFGGTKVGIQPSPIVSAFSSRGPNAITPQILKPDLIAPGVNILAGWSGNVGPTGLPVDSRRVPFNIISGTSMSCPHVSGLAALIKGAHPRWSPAAVRSALMTTAYTVYKNGQMLQDVATGKPSTPFDHGAGHVDPPKALDPGLIYDISTTDYLNFLCALNYTHAQISSLSKTNFTCNDDEKYLVADLNYPSFAVPFTNAGDGVSTLKYRRTLTNVGAPATYKVSVVPPSESVKIVVEPEELSFSEENEKKVYTVSFSSVQSVSLGTSFARLEWSDGKHVVRSPIAISWT